MSEVLYIEKEDGHISFCKKREDETLCVSTTFQEFGEDYDNDFLINKDQAIQIINHLKTQFES